MPSVEAGQMCRGQSKRSSLGRDSQGRSEGYGPGACACWTRHPSGYCYRHRDQEPTTDDEWRMQDRE